MPRRKTLANGLQMHWTKDARGKRVYVPVGADAKRIGESRQWSYTDEIADKIVEQHMLGSSLRAICHGKKGYPPVTTVYRWMQENHRFKTRILEARQMRAFYFENKVMEEAESIDEKNYNAQRVKIDAAKWLAQVNNPDVFGNKTKISGDASAPLAIVVDTGIHREEEDSQEAPAIETTAQVIEQLPEGESK